MYKLWLKLLTLDYIKIYVKKIDPENSASEKLIIISYLFDSRLFRSYISASKLSHSVHGICMEGNDSSVRKCLLPYPLPPGKLVFPVIHFDSMI